MHAKILIFNTESKQFGPASLAETENTKANYIGIGHHVLVYEIIYNYE